MTLPSLVLRLGMTTGCILGCTTASDTQNSPLTQRSSMRLTPELMATQALLAPWKGRFGGLPPFADIKVADFKPAFAAGMADMRAQIESIAKNPDAPTFENTIAALEDSGRPLDRVMRMFAIWVSTMSDSEVQALEQEFAPVLATFADEITQNEALFQRITSVYQSPAMQTLSLEQRRLTEKTYSDKLRAGAKLKPEEKSRLTQINQKLASLFTSFNQNLLQDESTAIILSQESELAGLSEGYKKAAAIAATERGASGKWAITNTRSSVEPFLSFASREDLREKVWRSFTDRGDLGNAYDNNKIISEILLLRTERAQLLGYPSHAHWRLEKSMAKTPDKALTLMNEVWPAALARAQEEVKDLLLLASKEDGKTTIQPWDHRYYSEKVRKAKYDLADSELRPYLQLESLREGIFWVANELYGLSFVLVSDIAVVHPDVRVWEVKDKTSGKHVGLWYFDPYARAGKRSGAWMNSYQSQETFRGLKTAIVSNNSNFVKGKPGEAVLISLSDATTLFHEFGHALHGLSSAVHYPSLAGTAVYRDYVEFPSQLLENWLLTPEVFGRFALHYETKTPPPKPLLDKILRAAKFNQGFQTVEYLASALIDMEYHLEIKPIADPGKFEQKTLATLGMPKEIVMRHRSTQFSHIFGGDSYSAGYYSYLWSDTLSSSAFEAFTEAKGPFDREIATRLKQKVLAVGNAVDPEQAFKDFRGRDPGSDALMRSRGFPLIKR